MKINNSKKLAGEATSKRGSTPVKRWRKKKRKTGERDLVEKAT